MTTAKEFFDHVGETRRAIERKRQMIETLRSAEGIRAQSYDGMPGSRSFNPNAVTPTDRRMDVEGEYQRRIDELVPTISTAMDICDELDRLEPRHEYGSILMWHYIHGFKYSTIAGMYGLDSDGWVYSEARAALAYVDEHRMID